MSASKILVLQVRTLYFNPSKRSVPHHSFVSVTTKHTTRTYISRKFEETFVILCGIIRILCEIWMSWQMLLVIAWNFFEIFFFKKDWYDLQGFKQKKCNSFDGCPNEKYQLILTGPKKNWRTQNLFQFLLRSDVLGDAGCQMVLLKWLEGKVCSFKRRR